jgi:hypothetical protein
LVDAVEEERQRFPASLLVDTANLWTRRTHPRFSLGTEVHDSVFVDLIAKLRRQVGEARKAWVLIRLSEGVGQLNLGPVKTVSCFDPRKIGSHLLTS